MKTLVASVVVHVPQKGNKTLASGDPYHPNRCQNTLATVVTTN